MSAPESLFPIFFTFESQLVFVLNDAGAREAKGSTVAKHTHPFFEFIFVRKGSLRYEWEKGSIRVRKGACLVIPPHLAHRRVVESDMALNAFHVMIVNTDPRDLTHFPWKSPSPPETEKVLASLHSETERKEAGFRTLSRSLVTGLLIPLLRKIFPSSEQNRASKKSPHPILVRAVQMMNDRIREEIGMSEIAGACGISVRHLARLFKSELGTSPQNYFFEKKMPMAYSTLVSDKTSTIRAIARELGFHDSAYFSRVIRERFGLSPKEIRSRSD